MAGKNTGLPGGMGGAMAILSSYKDSTMQSLFTLRAALIASLAGAAFAATAQTSPSTQPPAGGSPDRAAAVEAAFTRADANKDGKLSKEEAAKLPGVSAKFSELDADKDGALSAEEFSSAYVMKK
jgi:hypothetical protein